MNSLRACNFFSSSFFFFLSQLYNMSTREKGTIPVSDQLINSLAWGCPDKA